MELVLKSGRGLAFDKQLPVFNIFYPSQVDGENDVFCDGISEVHNMDFSRTRSVALYFHFPFCDTICHSCPFTRGKYTDQSVMMPQSQKDLVDGFIVHHLSQKGREMTKEQIIFADA